jgi:hypothetical protein
MRYSGTFLPSSVGMVNVAAYRVNIPDAHKELYCSTRLDSKVDLYRTIIGERLGDYAASLKNNSALDDLNEVWTASLLNSNHEDPELLKRNAEAPVFLSNRKPVNEVSDRRYKQALHDAAYQLVQKPGEMVIIPPGFYHQTYHLDETVSIASQYCNESNKDIVFDHMQHFAIHDKYMQAASIPRDRLGDVQDEDLVSSEKSRADMEAVAKKTVESLFKYICEEKFDPMSSEFHYDRLFSDQRKTK